jgi:hypothetical protein
LKDLEKPAHIMEADIEAAAAAQSQAEIKNAMRRHVDRMGKFTDWVKPEAIAARLKEHEEQAAAALARAIAMIGVPRELLVPPDPLPKHMQGQSASTIQAMLRNGWKPEEP